MRFNLFFISVLFALGCRKPGCVNDAGAVVLQTRLLASFKTLTLDDNINVYLIQAFDEKAVLRGPENILANVSLNIDNGNLFIQNNSTCRWLRNANEDVTIELYLKDLQKINYKGSGTITNLDTLRLDALQIESRDGAGNIDLTVNTRYIGAFIYQDNASITLHGNTASCFTYTNSRGRCDLSKLLAKNMVIEYGGLANTDVQVSDTIDAIIYFKGNINYKGSPFIKRSQYYDSGRLVKLP